MDTTCSRQPVTNVASDEYKVQFYFPVINSFLAEISRHFDANNLNIMKAIESCYPTTKFFLKTDSLQPLIDSYDLPKDKIEMEASLAKRILEGKELATTGDVLLQVKPLSRAFPNLSRLVRIAMIVAVSTAECERSFSTLKLITNHLRSTMGDERLANMVILSIERELSGGINPEDVVTEFSGLDSNRKITFLQIILLTRNQ
uniref:HAT C-terminal dimerisation domain-containing protein n=1 Tax=Amphimedon queenslandica TaxID=400682 RepID=A0A1X7U3I1_AMPQE